MDSHFSDLEVYHNSQQPGLEAVRDLQQPGLELSEKYADQSQYTLSRSPRRFCGLTPKVLWISFAIIAVIAIGVGAGVGVMQSHKATSSPSSPSPPPDLASSSTSSLGQNPTNTLFTSNAASSLPATSLTSNLTPSLTTTSVIGPSATLLRDCPSSNGTLFTSAPNRANPQTFLKFCSASLVRASSLRSDVAIVNEPTTSLDDCIVACATYNEAKKTGISSGADDVCNTVCWRNGFVNDEFPGQCFGFVTQNSTDAGGGTGNFQIADGTECDSAGWIDQRKMS